MCKHKEHSLFLNTKPNQISTVLHNCLFPAECAEKTIKILSSQDHSLIGKDKKKNQNTTALLFFINNTKNAGTTDLEHVLTFLTCVIKEAIQIPSFPLSSSTCAICSAQRYSKTGFWREQITACKPKCRLLPFIQKHMLEQ